MEPVANRPWWTNPFAVAGIILLVLVVIAIISLVSVFRLVRSEFRVGMCSDHLSQITTALVTYSSAEHTAWPVPSMAPPRNALDGHEARRITCQIFAIVARHQKLPVSLFVCPLPERQSPPPISGVAVPLDWGLSRPGVVAYALDWSSPSDPGAARAIMADRDSRAHGGSSLVVFGDGVELLRKENHYDSLLLNLQNKGVLIAQCENTLKERKISKDELWPFVSYVPSGNGEIIIRQYQGWATIHP